ncbi:MAG: hypothetical protein AABY22_35650, partial [Nanoarchaeota archaeon]
MTENELIKIAKKIENNSFKDFEKYLKSKSPKTKVFNGGNTLSDYNSFYNILENFLVRVYFPKELVEVNYPSIWIRITDKYDDIYIDLPNWMEQFVHRLYGEHLVDGSSLPSVSAGRALKVLSEINNPISKTKVNSNKKIDKQILEIKNEIHSLQNELIELYKIRVIGY